MEVISLDELFLKDRQSSYIIQLTGTTPKLGLRPRDKLIINRSLEYKANELALVVVGGKFKIEKLTQEFIQKNDPDSGDFIWGMVRAVIREFL